MRRNTSTRLAATLAAAGLLLLAPGRSCHGGGLLPIAFDPNGPTFLAANGSLSYDAATGELRAAAVPLTLSSPLFPAPGFVRFSGSPQLRFDIFVNPDGTFRSGAGGFALTGTIGVDGGSVSGTLVSGDVFAFGAEPSGPPTWVANALFDTTGGLLTQPQSLPGGTLPALFPIGGPPVGVDLFVEDVTSGTLGDFTRDFGPDKIKVQGGPTIVPEPAGGTMLTTALLILGLAGFVARRGVPAS